MKTFILDWLQGMSDYSEEQFRSDFREIEFGSVQWCLHSRTDIRSGDNFYMVRSGEGPQGIVMKGFFLCDPYQEDNWTDHQRGIYRVCLQPTFMVMPDHPKGILTVDELESAMPSFPWRGSLSGQELSEEQRAQLDAMWDRYVSRFTQEDFGLESVERRRRPDAGIDEALAIANETNYGLTEKDGTPSILAALRTAMAHPTEEGVVVSLLRDALGFPEWTPGDFRMKGFTEAVVDAVLEA